MFVTMKACAMKNIFCSVFSLLCLSVLAACSSSEKSENPKPQMVAEKAEVLDIEPVKGRLNVYTSMARAAKYNITLANRNLFKAVVTDTNGKNTDQIFASLLNVKGNAQQPFYEASRNLDFAIVYAATHLTQNSRYVQSYIYQKTAQQLALATIKAHQDTLFAQRKIKEINRKIATQEKSVKLLDEKLAKKGSLSETDLEYKKTLEVSIQKMENLKSFLTAFVNDFASLTKVENHDLHLQGKNFYELQDFDKRNQLSTFQNTAIDNRTEFDLARKSVYGFNPRDVLKNAQALYPETKRLDINGVDENTLRYKQSVVDTAQKAAKVLVNDVNAYLNEKDLELKPALLRQAFEQLGMAIMVQIELDYMMVRTADFDYVSAAEKAASLRDEIRQQERQKNLSDEARNALVDKRLALDEAEWSQTQISSERAMALRALYFHAGLSPFSSDLLKQKIVPIETALKKAFNQDMIDMLAKADNHAKTLKTTGNTWAKEDNWLEILIDHGGKKDDKPIILPLKPAGDFDPYDGDEYNKMPVMQLGAYRQKENADIEWQMLKEIYPEFASVKPKIESSMQGGKLMYRLILKSRAGGWLNICNKLRADKVECILRSK